MVFALDAPPKLPPPNRKLTCKAFLLICIISYGPNKKKSKHVRELGIIAYQFKFLDENELNPLFANNEFNIISE